MIGAGKYPAMNYSMLYTPFRESGYRTGYMLAHIFKDGQINSFVGRAPVFLAFGDTYYFPRLVKRALSEFNQRKRSVFLATPMFTTASSEEAFHETVVESSVFAKPRYNPAVNGFVSSPELFHFLGRNGSYGKGLLSMLSEAHSAGHPSAVMHGQLINLNSPADYIAIREVMEGRLSFPFPKNWVRRYRKELESITLRREGRAEHRERHKDAARARRRNINH